MAELLLCTFKVILDTIPWSQPHLPSKKTLCKLMYSLQAACISQAGPGDQVMHLTEGSGTGACALKVTMLLATLALRKTLVNRAFRHDV